MKIKFFILPAAIFFLQFPAVASAQCTICFSAATNYATGANPYGVASADFNNDGFKDLVVANWGASTVSLLLNTGSGTFGAASNFSVGTNPRSIVTGDFNSDGNADFATCNDGTVNVSVRMGNGAGNFGAVTHYAVAAAPECIVKADFNGDAKEDLATSNYGSQNTSILLNNGSGGFGAATNYPTGAGSFPYGLCTADFNNDTRADLVTVSYSSNNLSRLNGNGAGGFAAPVAYPTGSTGAYSACSADFNGDGNQDLAIANANTNNVSRLTGAGTGAFGAATTYAAGSFPFCVISGDFNLDNKKDLAVANYSSNNLSLLMGQGNGTFCAAVNFAVGTSPTSVCTADFNNDGKPDLAACNNNSNNVSVLLNCSTVLPLVLVSFECREQHEQECRLEWALNNPPVAGTLFRIEKSADGTAFETAATVEVSDESSLSFSQEIIATQGTANIFRLSATYPDGTSETLSTTSCETNNNLPALCRVYDQNGKQLAEFYLSPDRRELEQYSLPAGIYLLHIVRENEVKTEKLVRTSR